jgi:outer membrane protein, heavy metal efflux system
LRLRGYGRDFILVEDQANPWDRRGLLRMSAGAGREVLALLAVSALAACASTPTPAPADASGAAAAYAARRLDDRLRDLPSAGVGWNRAQWLSAAMQLNPQLAEARARITMALAAERTAAQRPNPTMNLFGEYVETTAGSSAWLYGLSLDFLLRRPGDRARARSYAALQTAIARSDLADSIWSVRAALRQAMLDLVASRDQIALLQGLISRRQQLLATDQARADIGEIARTEVLDDELELSRIQQRLRHAQARTEDALTRLAAVVGVPVSALAGVPIQWDGWADIGALAPTPTADWRVEALVGRPEIIRALREYDLASITLQGEVAKRWPQLHVTPGYAWGGQGVRADPLNDVAQENALGASFELPLFNSHQGPIAEARAGREAAGEHLKAVQALLYEQIERAEQAWPQVRQAWDEAIRITASAVRQREAEERALAAGAADRASVLSADVAATEAQLSLLQAAYEAEMAFAAMEDAYRRPLQGPESELPLRADPRS